MKREVAEKFIQQGHPVNSVLGLLKLSKSSYYYQPKTGKPGRKPSSRTYHWKMGWVENHVVVREILDLLEEPYVDYGYIKVTEYLKQKGYRINRKKVARLMREQRLMLPRKRASIEGRNFAKYTVPEPSGPFEYLELDIKVIYVRGDNRNAYLLSAIDLFHREVLGYRLGYSMRKQQVISLMSQIGRQLRSLGQRDSQDIPMFRIRTDNGSQFIAKLVREYLGKENIFQEFIRPATPQQNGHIEAFHSVLQRALIDRYEFNSFLELDQDIQKFMDFYNQDRIHSALCYRSPVKFLEIWKQGRIKRKRDNKNRLIFFFEETELRSSVPFEEFLFPHEN